MRAVSATALLILAGALSTAPSQTTQPPGSSKDSESKSASPTSYGGKTLAEWKKQLVSLDASKRSLAIMAVMQFGDSAAEAVPLLIQRTYDKDASPRSKALFVLRHVAVDDKDAPKVVDALAFRMSPRNESQISVRYEAALTLKRFNKDARAAIPALIQGTMDKGSWELRHQCAWILWRVTGPADRQHGEAVDALLDLVKNDTTYLVRLEAIQGLGGIGRPVDSSRLGRVVKLLEDCTNPRVRTPENRPLSIWAFASLVNLQEEAEAKAPLSKLAKYLTPSFTLETRAQAAQAIGSLGAKAKSKVPDLLAMLKDKETVAVMGACMALASVGDKSDKVIDGLLEVTRHKDPATAATAVISLVTLKANYARVTEALDKMREDKDLNIDLRKTIEQALKAIREKKS